MNSKESAFNDVLVTVATSNTATYLLNRLHMHPLVKYLSDVFSSQQLKDKLLQELKIFDKSLEKTTIILLLIQAVIEKSGTKSLSTNVRTALQNSKVMWAQELLSLNQEAKRNSAMTVASFPYSPKLQSSACMSSSTSASFTIGDQS